MRAVFVKLGGSLITDKTQPYSLRQKNIDQISAEIAALHKQDPELVWFIGNGAGSFGHYAVHEIKWRQNQKDPHRIAYVRQATARLNGEILRALLAHGVPAISLPAASFIIDEGNNDVRVESDAALRYAKLGSVPLIYGDIIIDKKSGSRVASTEEILDLLARSWQKHGHKVEAVIYCTIVDGVLDPSGETIPVLRRDHKMTFQNTTGYDVTGGMMQKVEAGLRALDYTETVHIIDGSKKGNLSKVMRHQQVGTKLKP